MTPNTAFKQFTVTPVANGFVLQVKGQTPAVYTDITLMATDVVAYIDNPTLLPWTGAAPVVSNLPIAGFHKPAAAATPA